MWATVASALASLLRVAGVVLGLFREQRARKDGAQDQAAATIEQVNHDVAKAQEARVAVEHDLAVHPDRLRDDDGFRRPD